MRFLLCTGTSIRRKGIAADGHATTPTFSGTIAFPALRVAWDGCHDDPDDLPPISVMAGPRDLECTGFSRTVESKPGARGVRVLASSGGALWLGAARPPGAMTAANTLVIPISLPNWAE